MPLRVLEIMPSAVEDLHERWNRLGIHALVVSYENAVQAITAPASSDLIADAIVIRCTDVPYDRRDASTEGGPADAYVLADRIRSLPETVAMFDGKTWCSMPIIVITSRTGFVSLDDFVDESGEAKVTDAELVTPNEENNDGADTIKKVVEDYRLAVLAEFDDLGFIVKFERGRYIVGPALRSRQELEGRYCFGPADQRPQNFTTIHRDNFGIQVEVEEFEALINLSEVGERQLQEFFEKHPYFLSEVHTPLSQVRLPAKDGSVLIPDFILKPIVAQKRDSKWEILDLKLPQERLLAGKGSRARLSSSVVKAIRQLRDYHENIQHPEHDREVEALLGHRLKYPSLGVLIGRLANTDVEVLEREQHYHPGVRIVTYDAILHQQQAQITAA